jgi:hypothetical protein
LRVSFLPADEFTPNGVEVVWNPANRLLKSWEGEAPAEPPNAGPRSGQLPAFLRSSRDRCSARGRDAAQQELRPPGTDSCQKVNASGLTPGNHLRQTQACVRELDPQCFNRRNPAKPVEFDRDHDAVERVTMVIGQRHHAWRMRLRDRRWLFVRAVSASHPRLPATGEYV